MGRPMKDSGVEWIGEIPEDWEVTKLKTIFSILGGNGFPEHLQGNDSGDYPFYKNSDLSAEEDKCIYYAKNYVTAHVIDENKFRVIPAESIIMSKIGEAMKKNHRKINVADCLIDNNLQALSIKNKTKYHLGFYFYVMCLIDSAIFDNRGTIPSINNNMLRNEYILYPMINKQKKIAAFLDRKTTHINGIVEKTKASIDAFKRYKQALITETVTKGLNPDVPMKDSGIEWIGMIPEHWDVAKLGQYFRQVKNKNTGMIEDNLLSLSYGNIVKKNINSNDGLLPESFEGYNVIKTDDIVLRMTDLQNDKNSLRTGYSKQNGIITSAYITIRKYNKIYSGFAHMYLHSFDISKGFYGMGSGVRQGVTFEMLKKLEIILPPMNEQSQIISYLDEKIAHIDRLIQNKQAMVEKLEAYKKSLIYEYVTGKKEVE